MDNGDSYSHRNAGVQHAAPFQTFPSYNNGSENENGPADPVEFTPCAPDSSPDETDLMVVSEEPAADCIR